MPNILKDNTKKYKYKGGVNQKTKKSMHTKTKKSMHTKMKDTKVLRKTPFPSKKESHKKNINPVFSPTEGEDDMEANLSVLIELMGSSLFDIYVEQVLNTKLEGNQKINVTQVSKPMSLDNLRNCKNPTIYYGKGSTHFTSSVDCKQIWDSYKVGVQKNGSDHFCQTFALMRMESHFFPDSYVGKQFALLHTNNNNQISEEERFFENAFIAKNVACHILNILYKDETDIFKNHDDHYEDEPDFKKVDDYFYDDVLNVTDRSGGKHKPVDKFERKSPKIILKKLIEYCENLTITNFKNSTFKQKILLLL